MIWKRSRIVLRSLALLLIVSAIMNSPPAVRADAFCRSVKALELNTSTSLQNQKGVQCFQLSLPVAQRLISVDVTPGGSTLDVYMKRGPAGSGLNLTSRNDKLNFRTIGPKTPQATFAVQNIAEGTYVLALAMLGVGNTSPVLRVNAASTGKPVASECSTVGGVKVCNKGSAITSGSLLAIGAQRMSQIAVPIRVVCPGPISATFEWSRGAGALDMTLVGPGSGTSMVEYDHRAGGSPLTVSHQSTQSETKRRDDWWVILTNTQGGTADGNIVITYPDPTDCPQGGAARGRITMLRINEVETGYGPPELFMDVEVVIRLDTVPEEAFGFQLRADGNEADHLGMLDLLRNAFNKNRAVQIEYDRNGTIFRVMYAP